MEKVTIAIPVYNVEKYVERALNSALNQTYPNIEILAIDDKGGDNSMDVVHRVQKEHPKGNLIRIIEHEHNRGTGATRNTGIDEATGKYLMYLDSDDEIVPDCIEQHYKTAKEINADLTIGRHNIIKSDLTVTPCCSAKKASLQLLSNQQVKDHYYITKQWFPVTPWNKLYKIDFLRKSKVRCIDHHINEDNLLCFQLIHHLNKVVFISNLTYNYYLYDNSTIGQLKSGKNYRRYLEQLYEITNYKVSYPLLNKKDKYYTEQIKMIFTYYNSTIRVLRANRFNSDDRILIKKILRILIELCNVDGISRWLYTKSYCITYCPLWLLSSILALKTICKK